VTKSKLKDVITSTNFNSDEIATDLVISTIPVTVENL
jgi:hypothetical protein